MTYEIYSTTIHILQLFQILDQILFNLMVPIVQTDSKGGAEQLGNEDVTEQVVKYWRLTSRSIISILLLQSTWTQHQQVCLRLHQVPQLLTGALVALLQIFGF